ncbi:MAG: hypothetical protein CTY13_05135 [Methylobacter sp.]|nr:MAG: hypothetical protein CTY13_05135 [Methylobacter sp.]
MTIPVVFAFAEVIALNHDALDVIKQEVLWHPTKVIQCGFDTSQPIFLTLMFAEADIGRMAPQLSHQGL